MRIGVLSFFPAFTPPKSGGELRLYHLYSRIARRHDVEILSTTYSHHQRERIEHAPRLVEHRIPKTSRYDWWHRFLDRAGGFRECSAFVVQRCARGHAELAAEAARLVAECDVIAHESPFLFPLAPRPRPGQLLVYNSYNVEGRLAREMFPRSLLGRWAARRVRAMERRCARAADLVLACSEEDAAQFADEYGIDPLKVRLAPNGVDTETLRPATPSEREAARRKLGLGDSARPAVLFLGSFHPPNIEAIEFILAQLASALPQADFLVAGRACKAFDGRSADAIPPNVRLLGEVSEQTRLDLLRACDAAVNPMFTGSGTNLKMLDYLASGLPVAATPRGARGLGLAPDRHALVCEPQLMAEGLARLLGDRPRAAAMAREARAFIERRYTWDAIAADVENLIEIKSRRRVVILNDFPVTPVIGGGQARLLALGRELARGGHGVTFLTLSAEENAKRGANGESKNGSSAAGGARILGPGLEELRVPRSRVQRWVDLWLAHRLGGISADDASMCAFGGWLTPRFGRVMRREARLARAAVFCHCYLIAARRFLPAGTPVVHEAFNVETDLKRQLYGESAMGRFLAGRVRGAETEALRRAAFTSCVSEDDAQGFRRAFPNVQAEIIVSPNGVDCAGLRCLAPEERFAIRRALGLGGEPFAIFLASGHPPNRDAAQFILEHVAPALPEVTFLIVGQVCGWFVSYPCPNNVLMLGIVPDTAKDVLLQISDVALNPMFSGSGTNLKIPDSLAAGLPVISTPVGARGFAQLTDGAVTVCEAEQFAEALRKLLASPEELRQRGLRAREIALRHFDWGVTLRDFSARMALLADREKIQGE